MPRSFFALLILTLAHPALAALSITDPRCEYRQNPLDIDVPHPRLSWKLTSDQPGQHQTAYQILVTTDTGETWDTGKVTSLDSIQIPYAGPDLISCQRCDWQVRVWDQANKISDWSPPAQWSTAFLSPSDWHAHWIKQPNSPSAALPIFRKQFTVLRPLRRAILYICGLGQFELQLNGQTVGADKLQPGWTDYHKTCLYTAVDITAQLKQGGNDLRVFLGNGMYNVPAQRYRKFTASFGPPMLIAQLNITDEIATTVIIPTDAAWSVASGPITFSSIYGGEDYDARLADPATWTPAVETPGPLIPDGRLAASSRSAPPIRVMQELSPIKITHPTPAITVYDLGQNCAIIPSITVHGSPGASVRLTPGELLTPDGTVTQASSGRGCYYTYTAASDAPATWSPRFCYYGARYIQAEGDAQITALHGLFISSMSPSVGDFQCSSDLFNRTAALIRWSIRSNMVSLLTDCPHREKLGWLEQTHLMGPSLMYSFDLAALLNKTCCDISDAQRDTGLAPEIAPEYIVFKGGFLDSPEWGSAAVLVPWNLYKWYGDLDALKSHYATMKRYVAYLDSQSKSRILAGGLGDWYDLGPKRPGLSQLTPPALTATAFYYQDLIILQQTARLLGHDPESAAYATQADSVRQAFNAKFYDHNNRRYAGGSQTADAIPLVMGLNPPEDASAILADLVADITRHETGLTAGDVGYRYVLRALADGGRSDVVFDMNRRTDRPGYGWQLDHGATSLTEAWNADPRSSQDHFMLGHIMEWFYSDLAGIQTRPDAVAFNHLRIKPALVGDLTWVTATYNSIRGPISSAWRRDKGVITLTISIPPGADAEVFVPAAAPDKVAAPGAKFLRQENGAAVFAVDSGTYTFISK